MQTNAPGSILLIRFLVGIVFLSEGIQKFLYADKLGVGRFIKIGLPDPHFLSPFVGTFEILCGTLVILGLITRLASIPLIIIISTAILTTKIPILLHSGMWAMLHEARTDMSMFLGSIFLLIRGGGKWSLDYNFLQKKKPVRFLNGVSVGSASDQRTVSQK